MYPTNWTVTQGYGNSYLCVSLGVYVCVSMPQNKNLMKANNIHSFCEVGEKVDTKCADSMICFLVFGLNMSIPVEDSTFIFWQNRYFANIIYDWAQTLPPSLAHTITHMGSARLKWAAKISEERLLLTRSLFLITQFSFLFWRLCFKLRVGWGCLFFWSILSALNNASSVLRHGGRDSWSRVIAAASGHNGEAICGWERADQRPVTEDSGLAKLSRR